MGYKPDDNMKVGLVKDALTMAIKQTTTNISVRVFSDEVFRVDSNSIPSKIKI